MTTFELSLLFFIIGVVEFAFDQWERLVSVRLKISSTLLYATLNHVIDFFMYVFLFSVLIQFWETWHQGVHDYYKLIPYISYTLGKIVGTVGALIAYSTYKKATEKKRRLELLEKARQKKKQLQNVKTGVSFKVQETIIEDEIEREDFKNEAKAEAKEQILEKIESVKEKLMTAVDQAVDEMVDPREGLEDILNGSVEEGIHDRDQSTGRNAQEKGSKSPSAS